MARRNLSQRLYQAVSSRSITIAELCQAVGITPQARETACDLWNRIINAYLQEREDIAA